MKKQTNEKLTDKAFLRLIITSAIGILICLVCLCSTTWAWFSSDVTFEDNQIKTAEQCLLTVSVKDTSTELTDIENGSVIKPAKAKAAEREESFDLISSLVMSRDSEAADKIRAVDLNTMTPIEAMNLLYELKKILAD